MIHNRAEKMAGALKKTISGIIQAHLKDPRVGFITITEVQVSKDLKHVKVFFTALGNEKVKKSAQIGLDHAASFIRRMVAEEMTMRCVPEIVFKYDETFEYGQHIEELFARIKKQEEEKNATDKEDNQGA